MSENEETIKVEYVDTTPKPGRVKRAGRWIKNHKKTSITLGSLGALTIVAAALRKPEEKDFNADQESELSPEDFTVQ